MIDLDINTMPLVFVDVETTGFSATNNRIIEVAAIRVENGEVVGKITSFINPDTEVPEVITGITGITDTEVKYAPPFAAIAPQLAKILEGAIMVAHNAKFDYSFIKAEFERVGLPFTAITLCTCEMARSLYPRMVNHKLGTIIEQLNFAVAERHRAYDDASVLIQFVGKVKDEFGVDRVRSVAQRVLV
jgi:DNA polymerase-3 subunit epsilon